MSEQQKNIFFPVEDVRYEDLYDWSKAQEKCQTKTGVVKVRRLQRQNSATGALVELNETNVALFRYGSKVYAIDEKCPHAGGPLHVGDIEVLPDKTLCVRCPWHSWRIDLESGNVKIPAGRKDKRTSVYPVKVTQQGQILVGFESFSSHFFQNEDF